MGNRDSWTQAPQHCVPVPVSRYRVRRSPGQWHNITSNNKILWGKKTRARCGSVVRERLQGAPPCVFKTPHERVNACVPTYPVMDQYSGGQSPTLHCSTTTGSGKL